LNTRIFECPNIQFFAYGAFIRANRCAIAMMFVRPSLCLSGTGMHCDHMVHVNVDLSLLLHSPVFLAPDTYSQKSFSNSTWKRGWVWMCKLAEALNANNDKLEKVAIVMMCCHLRPPNAIAFPT